MNLNCHEVDGKCVRESKIENLVFGNVGSRLFIHNRTSFVASVGTNASEENTKTYRTV